MGLHLWYLEMLFVYSLLTLPLFLWLRSERMGPIISRLAGSLAKPSAIFLLAAPGGSVVGVMHSWFWLAAIIGFAHRYLTLTNRFLRYANEAVLPFYILHQTIILLIGYHIVQLDTSIVVKYVVVTTLSFVAIGALYEPLIRRFNVLRFLFGMKPNADSGE